MSLVQMNFESVYLGNNTNINIILPDKPRQISPDDFYGGNPKYKVLWLLHGTFGDYSDWVRKTNIERYACEKDLMVVMPSAMNSNYVNWPKFGMGFNMWDFMTKELMPMIYGWYPASSKREDNFIAGLSMGGRGTATFAFSHPELFAGAAILSASPVQYTEEVLQGGGNGMGNRTAICVENAGGPEGFLASPENVWDIAKKQLDAGVELPRLYFTCGGDDTRVASNLAIWKEYADSIGLEATYKVVPGYRHEWRFWDLAIQDAMTFFGLTVRDAGNPF